MRGSPGVVNVAGVPWYNVFNSNLGNDTGKGEIHILILLLATICVTFCKSYAKKTKIKYKDIKYRNLFLKTRKFYNRHKMLLIVPKIVFFTFYVLTSGESQKRQRPFFNDLQTTGTKSI